VTTVETSRYARPGAPLPDISHDAHDVLRRVRSVRGRGDRLRAAWWPSDGLEQWRSWRDAAVGAMARPARALARAVTAGARSLRRRD
jgi:hypothetical protein